MRVEEGSCEAGSGEPEAESSIIGPLKPCFVLGSYFPSFYTYTLSWKHDATMELMSCSSSKPELELCFYAKTEVSVEQGSREGWIGEPEAESSGTGPLKLCMVLG